MQIYSMHIFKIAKIEKIEKNIALYKWAFFRRFYNKFYNTVQRKPQPPFYYVFHLTFDQTER